MLVVAILLMSNNVYVLKKQKIFNMTAGLNG